MDSKEQIIKDFIKNYDENFMTIEDVFNWLEMVNNLKGGEQTYLIPNEYKPLDKVSSLKFDEEENLIYWESDKEKEQRKRIEKIEKLIIEKFNVEIEDIKSKYPGSIEYKFLYNALIVHDNDITIAEETFYYEWSDDNIKEQLKERYDQQLKLLEIIEKVKNG